MSRNILIICAMALLLTGCNSEEATNPSPDAGDNTTPETSSGSGFAVTSENTKVLFVGTKKSGDSQAGGFKEVSGTIGVDGDKITSVNVVIQVDSLFSDQDKLTGHLKNEDFFSVKEFPELTFASSKVEGSGEVTITGELNMHGQTGEISFPATVSVTDGNVKLDAKFKVDRTKFGMNYTGQPDNPINAEVDIEILVNAE